MNEFASKSLLFNPPQAARAIAYTLRGVWDGCNGVNLEGEIDEAALTEAIAQVALELSESLEYCNENEYCQILFSQKLTSTETNDKTVELENFNIALALGRKLGCQFVIGSQDITALFGKGE